MSDLASILAVAACFASAALLAWLCAALGRRGTGR